jgi:uncharacterized protein (UPF0332 family)
MPIDGIEFLKFAELVHKTGYCENEIGCRCSISRAYYGAFHMARVRLDMGEYANHQQVIEGLIDHGNDTLSSMLLNLHKKRKHADYRLAYTINKEQTQKYLEKCNKFIEEIRKINSKEQK